MIEKKENKYFIYDKIHKINFIFIIKYIITFFQSIYYRNLIYILGKRASREKKYYVSICGIFKDEANYLKEWIEYNRIIGVDHIYLYNNNSTDNYYEIIEPYINLKYITLVNWEYNQKQMEAYHHCFDNYKNETSWLGFIDIDEFIVPIEDNTISDFLRKNEKKPSILIYWKMFGSNKLISRDIKSPVIKDFTACWYKYDDVGKCFVNTEFEISNKNYILHHMLWTKKGFFNLPPTNCCGKICIRDWYNPVNKNKFPIQINHYVLKSWNEYKEKIKKTDVMFSVNPKGKDHFKRHDYYSTSEDFEILKYLKKLERNLNNE